ncbi:MAG: hypothetical protein KatS3mg095_0571 [Candidatus Parcubacteria bacterium]|nr:MAG: hypothetical protein KatS3mg095_0571 [Candidatus Parcubacteria bacterium]
MNFLFNRDKKKYLFKQKESRIGLTLLEVIFALALLGIFFVSIITFFLNFKELILINKIRFQTLSVLQDEIEKIRAMDYQDIGIVDGWPPGSLPKEKTINKNGFEILVKYYVKNIDDPKDGTISSQPKDTAPADYKLIELEGDCVNCLIYHKPQLLTTIIAPKTVESRTGNGSIFIQVLDANGLIVERAKVKVNYLGTPSFEIEDLTDNSGFLRLIDVPPIINGYRIYVSKEGYSKERTYPPLDESNPNPILPDQTVRSGELTTVTLKIDKLSNLNFNFINKFCQPLSGVQFSLEGEKLIGQDPNIIKTTISTTSDENGKKNFSIEWDNYMFKINSSQYVIKGLMPYLRPRINVLPNGNYNFQITLVSSSPINLLVTVFDQNKNYLSDAEVNLTGNNFSSTEYTGLEKIIHNDWVNNYSALSNNIDLSSEKIRLKDIEGYYPTSTEWLISKTIDFGTSSTQFKIFSWEGNNQEGSTSVKFQIAANNDNWTWNFVGPDGTSNSYFETLSFSLDQFNGNRFLRYKVYLKTDDSSVTPIVDQIKISYFSSCLSPGQVIFQNLSAGDYILKVNKQGFSSSSQSLSLSSNEIYKEVEINLSSD